MTGKQGTRKCPTNQVLPQQASASGRGNALEPFDPTLTPRCPWRRASEGWWRLRTPSDLAVSTRGPDFHSAPFGQGRSGAI